MKLRIEGMDCGSCAIKIENAMRRLPGESDINVSQKSQESVSLSLDENRTSPRTIEDKIRALGFTPISDRQESPAMSGCLPQRRREAWWQGRKGRLVVLREQCSPSPSFWRRSNGNWVWAYSAAALVSKRVAPLAAWPVCHEQ
ncbi:heavy-metal-associated domain-containing protein [Aminobacter niigataensis]|uniref:heavy-metal-associated domain-containing protein n=1 Tax=Aminobacter niigataensis TaxID=83265 RepID=UPI001FEC6762|nr:heavy metal-associated domain-containing protein [Aminobacter niigataensis]